MTHESAKKELAAGTPAEVICATCPWDRLCVEPPALTPEQVKQQIAEAEATDKTERPGAMPMGALMTALVIGGRDTSGKMCPVFSLRLRGPDGRTIADGIRNTMRTWGDPS